MTPEPAKKLSRQQKWQLRKMREGNCIKCGKPSEGRRECIACLERSGVKKHFPLKSQWDAVDFTQPQASIAQQMGVSASAVSYQMLKRGIRRPHPKS